MAMFEEKKEPLDIFGEVDPVKGVGQQSVSPVADVSTSAAPVVRHGPPVWIFLIVGLVALGGLGYGGYYFMMKPAAPAAPTADVPETPAPVVPTPAPVVPETVPQVPETPATVPEPVAPEVVPEPIAAVDTDADGLTDDEEAILGTNLNNPDTDADGLNDREEVRIYQTNPLIKDTDGDTYEDGAEVKGGYSPNGPGRLLNLPPGA